ncbi:MAG: hypothetical protein V7K97_30105 [Nostoc sp.]|uniref:hypothetical protein n=1 Tax=Nostoc sp. TaxID=1180 RepID=UPI002FFA079B
MDFIKKLISGILGFFAGLLPGKKKSNGYFLELEEATSQSKPAASNGKKAQEPVAIAAPAASEAAKATKVANKTKVEASQNGKAAKAESAKAAATTKTPTETTFAPKYLAPSTTSSNGRRRPGANMSAYLDMARQVKTPK